MWNQIFWAEMFLSILKTAEITSVSETENESQAHWILGLIISKSRV